jgi:antitoxin ParD1/3/4
MPTRNVVLTDHQAQMIERLVASGRYQNASEVLREGLRLVEQREAEDAARLIALREAARVGIEDIEAGRFRTFETPEALDEYLKELTKQVLARDGTDE